MFKREPFSKPMKDMKDEFGVLTFFTQKMISCYVLEITKAICSFGKMIVKMLLSSKFYRIKRVNYY